MKPTTRDTSGSALWADTAGRNPVHHHGVLSQMDPPPWTISLGCLSDLQEVIELQRQDSNALGFLPQQAIFQMWKRSRLWVATLSETGSERPLGYAITAHNSRRPAEQQLIRVQQICVHRSRRGQGIGAAILARIEQFAETCQYPGVQARVAEPLPANGFWKACGYQPFFNDAGNNARRRRIITYRKTLQKQVPLWIVMGRKPHS